MTRKGRTLCTMTPLRARTPARPGQNRNPEQTRTRTNPEQGREDMSKVT
nr:MAG TPA: hypothetical protein [Caudoviricetes sp.]